MSPSTSAGSGAAEEEPLRVVAADHAERVELGRRLEPFGHRGQPERMRERDDRLAHHARVFVVPPEPVDEAAIDLQGRYREALREPSDEYPVPKSSMLMYTPRSRSLQRMVAVAPVAL